MSFGSKPAPIAAVDATGKPLAFPLAVAAATPILGSPATMWSTGKVVVSIAIARGQPQAVVQVVQNGTALDIVTVGSGGTMNAGAKYDFQTGVQGADTVNIQMDRKTQLALLEVSFVQDLDL